MDLEYARLFQGLSPQVLEEIGSIAQVTDFEDGETVFCEGEPAHDLCILRDGRVELTFSVPQDPDMDVRITHVEPGEIFAWSALAQGETHTANAHALVPSSIFMISGIALHGVFERYPAAGYTVMRRLSQQILQRLRKTRRDLRWFHLAAR